MRQARRAGADFFAAVAARIYCGPVTYQIWVQGRPAWRLKTYFTYKGVDQGGNGSSALYCLDTVEAWGQIFEKIQKKGAELGLPADAAMCVIRNRSAKSRRPPSAHARTTSCSCGSTETPANSAPSTWPHHSQTAPAPPCPTLSSHMPYALN